MHFIINKNVVYYMPIKKCNPGEFGLARLIQHRADNVRVLILDVFFFLSAGTAQYYSRTSANRERTPPTSGPLPYADIKQQSRQFFH